MYRWHGRGHIKTDIEVRLISKYLGVLYHIVDSGYAKVDCMLPTIYETYYLLFTQPYISQNFVSIRGVEAGDVDFYGGLKIADYCPSTQVRNEFKTNSSPLHAM